MGEPQSNALYGLNHTGRLTHRLTLFRRDAPELEVVRLKNGLYATVSVISLKGGAGRAGQGDRAPSGGGIIPAIRSINLQRDRGYRLLGK